jgi:hypothetical protein
MLDFSLYSPQGHWTFLQNTYSSNSIELFDRITYNQKDLINKMTNYWLEGFYIMYHAMVNMQM